MWFQKRTKLMCPISGTLIPLSEVNDPTFSEGMMGTGIAIIPNKEELISPSDGTIKMIFPTKHAIGIQCDDGKELLIHAGIDTVELGGKGFDIHVTQGDHVQAGTTLMSLNLSFIKEQGYDPTIIMVYPSQPDIKNVTKKVVMKGEALNLF